MVPPRPVTVIVLSLASLCASCHEPGAEDAKEHGHENGNGHDENGHDHDHGVPTYPVTVWQEGFELFAEYESVTADVPTRFITHITDLSTGEPRRRGPVTFRLQGPSGESTEQIEDRPIRDGIYLPELTFPEAGTWSLHVVFPSGEDTVEVRLPEIVAWKNAQEALHAPAPEEPEGISFLKEQQWQLSLRTEEARERTLVAHRRFPGRTRAERGRRVSVASPLSGRLVAGSRRSTPRVGDRVEAGELLARVEPTLPSSDIVSLEIRLAKAEAEEIRSEKELDLARKTLARTKRLRRADAASARELERARFEVETAEAALETAIAVRKRYEQTKAYTKTLDIDGHGETRSFNTLELRAPIAGTIVRAAGSPGEHVTPEVRLFTILDASSLVVEAGVPEREATGLGKSPGGYIELMETGAGRPRRLPLEFFHAGLEVDESTRRVPFLYRADNNRGLLRTGMSVDVLIETAPPSRVVSVPASALVDEDGAYVVFVQVAGETFAKRKVELGRRDGEYVEVREGVSPGERVVTSAPWAVRLASLSTAVPAHGHEH